MKNLEKAVNVYVANLGKYNEGKLVGAWISLPATDEELENLYVKIGVAEYIDGVFNYGKIEVQNGFEVVYEEVAIHDYECNIEGLEITEYTHIEDLNQSVHTLMSADSNDLNIAEALVEAGYYDDVVEALNNTDSHTICYANNDRELGEYIVDEIYGGTKNLDSDKLEYYFDYEKYGRDLVLSGAFIASNGVAIVG
jgi:antirestriction protein